MKILFIITGFGDSDEVGGAATHTLEVAKRFHLKGHEIHFLTTVAGRRAISRYGIGAKYHIIRTKNKPEDSKFNRLLSYFFTTLLSPRFIGRLSGFDVVISNDDYFCETIPSYLYRSRHVDSRWIAYAHEPPVKVWYHRFLAARKFGHKIPLKDCYIHLLYYPFQMLSFLLFRLRCDTVLIIGTEGDLVQRQLKMPLHRIKRVGNGVDLEQIQSVVSHKKLFDACFLGGNRSSKGIYDLIPVWKEVIKKKREATLLVIGVGTEGRFQETVVNEKLQERIVLAGHVADRRKLFQLMKSSRVFVFPSHKEGWALPVTEAMACGLPVVAWDYPFYYDIYPKGIIYVPLGRFDKFAEQIERLLDDKRLHLAKSKDAQECVKQYTWDKVASRELQLICQSGVDKKSV